MRFLYINFVVALWVTAVATLVMGFFVLVRNRKNIVNSSFAFYSFAISWWSFCQIWLIACDKKLTALTWARIEQIGVFFIPTFFAHFVISLLAIKNKKPFLIIFYSLSIIFAFLCPTPLMMADAIPKETVKYVKYFATPGFAYHFAILFFIIAIFYGLSWLHEGYRSSSGAKKNQLKYLFWSSLFGYAGGAANFLLVYGISIPFLNPFGTYALPIYISVVAYAIIRFRLMDINVALTRASVFAIVYMLVLGVPLGLTAWGRYWLENLLGQNWYWAPVMIAIILATAGPFIFMHLLRRAEDIVFKERRKYQEAITNFSKSIIDIRNLDQLFDTITTALETVKINFAVIYLKSEEQKSLQLKSCYPKNIKEGFPELISEKHPLINSLLQYGRPMLSEELRHEDKIIPEMDLIIPCFSKDGLLSLIILGHKQNNQMYTTDDILVFETLSYSAGLAIENCIYWKEIEDRQRKARLQEMDTYSYSLAHEIDNPIQVILGQTGLMKNEFIRDIPDENKRKEATESFDYIIEAARRVSGMVKAIRDFGQPVTGEFKPLKIEDIAESFSKLYFPQFKTNGVIFEKEIPDNLGFLRGEKPELMQVFVILANNAIHAMQYCKEKKIRLKIEHLSQDSIKIIFSDSGHGIKKELLPIIFAPFTTTKASSEGTGMGLYNAKKIVERHKGKIWAESQGIDKGAAFIIELPIAKDITEEELRKQDTNSKRLI